MNMRARRMCDMLASGIAQPSCVLGERINADVAATFLRQRVTVVFADGVVQHDYEQTTAPYSATP